MAKRRRSLPLTGIPRALIDFLLMERNRKDSIERFTQSGGIVADVWYEFADDLTRPVRVLVAPTDGVDAVEVGSALFNCISGYRTSDAAKSIKAIPIRRPLSVSPLENYIAVSLYVDELIRIVLPLTAWWRTHGLGLPNETEFRQAGMLDPILHNEIVARLRGEPLETRLPPSVNAQDEKAARRVREAAPVAALIGLIAMVSQDYEILKALQKEDPNDIRDWVYDNAENIAKTAVEELSNDIPQSIWNIELSPTSAQAAGNQGPPTLIYRVFLDRRTSLAVAEGACTIKSDAANRVFNVSCSGITWGIIDAGIDPTHPAFENHDPRQRSRTRIKAILDFTAIEQIRNFSLAASVAGTPARDSAVANVISQLKDLPDYPFLPAPEFDKVATRNLNLIADQLRQRLQPDWNLIEPLIRRRGPDQNEPEPEHKIVSSHGTHVAGILGADWRAEKTANDPNRKAILKGVCPEINFYDLRVIDPDTREDTEFAVLAALEYVQFANRRTLGMRQVIHGVNISLQIPHSVRTYACGATPICVASNNLVGSGVVVVAAAGNRGWNEQAGGFGNFVFCSITDPGNAEDVITVGSTHRQRPHSYGVSYFSSRGPTGDGRIKPDLVAPGEKINGPIPGVSEDQLDGTSMAAPFVSGAAAMLIARNSELMSNPRRIKQILCDSATDLGREKYFQGHGLVDALRALQSV